MKFFFICCLFDVRIHRCRVTENKVRLGQCNIKKLNCTQHCRSENEIKIDNYLRLNINSTNACTIAAIERLITFHFIWCMCTTNNFPSESFIVTANSSPEEKSAELRAAYKSLTHDRRGKIEQKQMLCRYTWNIQFYQKPAAIKSRMEQRLLPRRCLSHHRIRRFRHRQVHCQASARAVSSVSVRNSTQGENIDATRVIVCWLYRCRNVKSWRQWRRRIHHHHHQQAVEMKVMSR